MCVQRFEPCGEFLFPAPDRRSCTEQRLAFFERDACRLAFLLEFRTRFCADRARSAFITAPPIESRSIKPAAKITQMSSSMCSRIAMTKGTGMEAHERAVVGYPRVIPLG